jgi:hypothetical protein
MEQNDFNEGAEPERVDVMQSGPSRKAEDATPVAAQPILQNGQNIQFQRIRFARASANVSTAKKRKRTDGSVDRGLSIAFRLVVLVFGSNFGADLSSWPEPVTMGGKLCGSISSDNYIAILRIIISIS